jgi:hypothetical protein
LHWHVYIAPSAPSSRLYLAGPRDVAWFLMPLRNASIFTYVSLRRHPLSFHWTIRCHKWRPTHHGSLASIENVMRVDREPAQFQKAWFKMPTKNRDHESNWPHPNLSFLLRGQEQLTLNDKKKNIVLLLFRSRISVLIKYDKILGW